MVAFLGAKGPQGHSQRAAKCHRIRPDTGVISRTLPGKSCGQVSTWPKDRPQVNAFEQRCSEKWYRLKEGAYCTDKKIRTKVSKNIYPER